MDSVVRFEDLRVRQSALVTVNKINWRCNAASFFKGFELLLQIRRSAVCIMCNIAEGFEGSELLQIMSILQQNKKKRFSANHQQSLKNREVRVSKLDIPNDL